MDALSNDGLAGGVIGLAVVILGFALLIAWVFLPIFVYQMRNDVRRHLAQQAKMQKTLDRLQRDLSDQS